MSRRAPSTADDRYRAEILQLLQGGRNEGIFHDHRITLPLQLARLPPLSPITDIREPFEFSAEDELRQHNIQPYILEEKTALDKATVQLFKAVQMIPAAGRTVEEELLAQERQGMEPRSLERSTKLEEPITPASFMPRIRLKKKHLKALPLDEDADEGVTWSRGVRKQVCLYQREFLTEEFITPKDVQSFLESNVAAPEVVDLEPEPPKLRKRELLSPPLLPWKNIKPPELPPIPKIDVKPGPEETMEDLQNELEEQIFAVDHNSSSPQRLSTATTPPTSPIKLPEDIKVEEPLLPATPPRRVRFESILATDAGSLPRWKTPPTAAKEEPDEDFDKPLREEVLQLERELEQEQLMLVDSKRLPVPAMEFSNGTKSILKQNLVQELRDELLSGKIKRWGGTRSVEIGLRWCPFQPKEVMLQEERIEEEVESWLLKEKEGEEAETEMMESFRIWGLEDEDEEMEGAEFAREERKLKEPEKQKEMEVIDITMEPRSAATDQSSTPAASAPAPPQLQPAETGKILSELIKSKAQKRQSSITSDKASSKRQRLDQKQPVQSTIHTAFSKHQSLASFLDLNGHHALPPSPPRPSPVAPTPIVPIIAVPPLVPVFPFPAPPPPAQRGDYVISTALLCQRSLTSHIRRLYPQARFIERDYLPSSPDADLIISPLLGLTIASLHRLRQRSSPDSPAGEAEKRRIAELAVRYERLIVIVHSTMPLGPSDRVVLAGVSGWAATVQGVVLKVVQGSEEDVAAWLVGIAGDQEKDIGKGVMEDETEWEVFLRVMGVNAFAAQVVIRELGKLGIAGFVNMEETERRMFLRCVVGRKVAARVDAVVGSRWS
ncbi:hypothetical protein FPQ18DRAFT_380331 [Pyronema domesticum]|uniref:Uncharacterized protein n=1 Tax=Pyronema omphalodes (strain CBS 100304) TaxID=1076935 RepID=U4LE56_PYROM|nr:hypothetical protein FPQ18DRAFT_380331 [Pyronema domesticum]CCX29792.1 Similar to hypothetical protein M7I_5759 [Glarea lozoyensis 74030]; acc. no. EHK98458 [Pyronema omphalodes CBS 100304]